MKQCPECGEMLGNEAAKCFKCGRDVEDECGTDCVSESKSEYVPPITGGELLLCIIQPALLLYVASMRYVFFKERAARRFILPSFISLTILYAFGAIVGTIEMKILAGIMIVPALLTSVGMKVIGKKDFKESVITCGIGVGVASMIFCILALCYLIYLYIVGLEA